MINLGNVRVLVNDIRPLGVPLRADTARVTAVRNYYPYGMLKAHKTTTANYHRYGFNSMEMDNEQVAVVAGEEGTGNSYDFGMRNYDSRLGRFLSLDPIKKKFPGRSNYIFAADNPVVFIDYEGLMAVKGNAVARISITNDFAIKASAGLGVNIIEGDFQTGSSISFNFYDDGLGTPNNMKEAHLDMISSFYFTYGQGNGKGDAKQMNHFNKMTPSTSANRFSDYSVTKGWSYAIDLMGDDTRGQLIGSLGFSIGRFSANIANDTDLFPFLGGGTDWHWSSMVNINYQINKNTSIKMSNEVFTGRRIIFDEEYKKGEYYTQISAQEIYNNEETNLSITHGNFETGVSLLGPRYDFGQRLIHAFMNLRDYDKSSAINQEQTSVGTQVPIQ